MVSWNAVNFRALILAATLLNSCHRDAETPFASGADAFPILTPETPTKPRITGGKIFGVRPGSPFFFQVTAAGRHPFTYEASGLPVGLTISSTTGEISGTLSIPGRYPVNLRVQNSAGTAERLLTIVVGDEIALTPPMGWNSFNAFGNFATQEQVLAAAHALVRAGLRDHGWLFVNVDDGWQGNRGGPFHAIQPNKKFPDIQSLANQIHGLGLKFGLYSTPARTTFGWHIGSSADNADGTYDWIADHTHDEFYKYTVPEYHSRLEDFAWLKPFADHQRKKFRRDFTRDRRTIGYPFIEQDVRQWTAWGVDYLKYDWLPIDVPNAEAMRAQLRHSGRDIVYSLSNNAPFALAPQLSRIANAWRTSVDIEDTWKSVSAIGFAQDKWAPYQSPSHYNDPDMLVLGHVIWSRPGPTRLTSDEQYTHMSLWCLLSGPLLLGADLDKLDPFTLGLLTNDDVLDVHQDSLCHQAKCVARDGDANVYAKTLDDGSRAVGLFNRGRRPMVVRARWNDLGLTRPQLVRDLWRQKDLGKFSDQFETTVAPHGVVLLKIAPIK